MNQKGFTSQFIALGILVLLGMALGIRYLVNGNTGNVTSGNPKELISDSPQTSIAPDSNSAFCDDNGQISLQKTDKTILLNDTINDFQLDVSSLPEIQKPNVYKSGCEYSSYEADMYNLRITPYEGSVARFSLVSKLNEDNLELKEYAQKEYNYKEGIHTSNNNYGQPYKSSPLKITNLPNGQMLVSWEDIYTEEERYREGLTGAKFYITSINNHILVFSVLAWDIPNFKKATAAFDKIIATLKPLN